MKTQWINKKNNDSCILFFNGWGMDENGIKHIDPGNNDLLMFYDYSEKEGNFNQEEYQKVYVIAWSLGVYAAASFLKRNKVVVDKSIAINGTLNPIDAKYGIAPAVFDATVNNWDVINRTKFNMRMFGGRGEYQQMTAYWPQRSVENQYEELVYLWNTIKQNPVLNFRFDVALIGKQDLIFTSKNQLDFWGDQTNIIELNMPHFPFKGIERWQELIEM